MPKVELEVPKEIVAEKSDVRDLFYDKNVAKITIASWISWLVFSRIISFIPARIEESLHSAGSFRCKITAFSKPAFDPVCITRHGLIFFGLGLIVPL